MEKHLLSFRDKLIFDSWNFYEDRMIVEDIAKVFNTSPKTVYRIIRRETLKVENKVTKKKIT